MAVEYKIDIDSGITERGIYLAELKVFHKEISVTQEVVFSRYHKEDTFKKFWQHYKVSHFGIKEKVNLKQIVHLKVTPKIYLSDVNIYTYNSWLQEQENKKL